MSEANADTGLGIRADELRLLLLDDLVSFDINLFCRNNVFDNAVFSESVHVEDGLVALSENWLVGKEFK